MRLLLEHTGDQAGLGALVAFARHEVLGAVTLVEYNAAVEVSAAAPLHELAQAAAACRGAAAASLARDERRVCGRQPATYTCVRWL